MFVKTLGAVTSSCTLRSCSLSFLRSFNAYYILATKYELKVDTRYNVDYTHSVATLLCISHMWRKLHMWCGPWNESQFAILILKQQGDSEEAKMSMKSPE